MSRVILVFLLVTAATPIAQVSAFSPADLATPSLIYDFWKGIKYVWNLCNHAKLAYDISTVFPAGSTDASYLLNTIIADTRKVSSEIKQFSATIDDDMKAMIKTINDTLHEQNIQTTVDDIFSIANRVDKMFDEYITLVNASESFNPHTLETFASNAVGNRVLKVYLEDISQKVIPERTADFSSSLVKKIGEYAKAANLKFCDAQRSPHQHLMQLFKHLLLTETKGLAVATFSYGLLHVYKGGKFSAELNTWHELTKHRLENYISAIRAAMKEAPRDIRRCDASKHVKDETYLELEHFMQSIIVNENINTTLSFRQSKNCVINGMNVASFCSKDKNCLGYTCHGKISHCTTIGETPELCVSPASSRRYNWVKTNFDAKQYFQDKIYGDNEECSEQQKTAVRQNAIVPPEFGIIQALGTATAHYCMCNCIQNDPKTSLIAISFREQLSNIQKNKVVTGIKFERANNMIHIKIKTGTLLPYGNINATTEKWRELENIKLFNDEGSDEFYLFDSDNNLDKKLRKNMDYGLLSNTSKTLYLDNVNAGAKKVVTGVRFRYTRSNGQPGPIRLEIRVTPFNYITGKVVKNTKQSQWIHALEDNSNPRKKVTLHEPNNPILMKQNELSQSSNQYVEFTISDLTKDAGQSTVPFIDAQAVTGLPSYPLSGVGLYHRGHKGYGGFIGFRIMSIDYSAFFSHDVWDNFDKAIADASLGSAA